jgi:hypothetical protein
VPSHCQPKLALRARASCGAAILSAVVAACGTHVERKSGEPPDSKSSPADVSAETYRILGPGQVDSMKLSEVAFVSLGTDTNSSPRSIHSLAVSRNGIALADGVRHQIRNFDRSGRSKGTLQYDGVDGSLKTPVSISVMADTAYVLDLDENRGVTVTTEAGRISRRIPLETGSSGFSIAATENGLIGTGVGSDAGIRAGTVRFAYRLDHNGRKLSTMCTPDPVYAASIARNGMFQLFRAAGVSTRDGRVFCRQPVSPLVQVFDTRGNRLPYPMVAPPFYLRQNDAPQSMNQRALERFAATWTEHRAFHPTADGYLSVYSRFDPKAQRVRFQLFRCRAAKSVEMRCGVAESEREPLAFVEPDTIVTAAFPATGDRRAQLHFSVIR